MAGQVTTRTPEERKRLYDRVQELVAENLPVIPVVSPTSSSAPKRDVGNFRPAILDPHTLWNVEELFWRQKPDGGFP